MAKKNNKETPQEAVIRLTRSFDGSEYRKNEIRELMAGAGLEGEINEGCSQCWFDALALLRNHYGITSDVAKPVGRVIWL